MNYRFPVLTACSPKGQQFLSTPIPAPSQLWAGLKPPYRRRVEGIPFMHENFAHNVATRFSPTQTKLLVDQFTHPAQLDSLSISTFLDGYITPEPDINRLLA